MRTIGGIVAGVVTWFVAVVALDFILRHAWPDYAAVEKAMTFTVPMMAARLSESGISSIICGLVATLVSRERTQAPLWAGIVLLLPFLYYHCFVLWAKFPIWYHATFLTSLVVLSVLGGRLAPAGTSAAARSG
jgi:hypothetical protein